MEKSSEGRRQYDALNGRGVPVLKARGTVVHGYDKRKMLTLLE